MTVLTRTSDRADPPAQAGGRPLDVCVASPRFLADLLGPAVRFKRYSPGLAARGCRLHVFASTEGSRPEGAEPVTDSHLYVPEGHTLEAVHGLPVIRAPNRYENAARSWAAYGNNLRRYALEGRPDVIQFLSFTSAAVPLLRALDGAGVATVYTHTMIREPSGGALSRWVKNRIWRRPADLMQCIVVSSGLMGDDLRSQGVRARIEVIPNGVDLQRFAPVGGEEARRGRRRELGLPTDGRLVVFIGHRNHRKGADVLADAWARLSPSRPDVHLLMISPRKQPKDPAYVERLEGVLGSTGTGDRVIFDGPVENVEAYLQCADVFAFPSRREGMPNVVPEAFSCAVPSVVAPFVGLPAEFGRPGTEFVLSERTGEAFAHAIGSLLDDPEARQRIGGAARAWVEANLGVERSLDRYSSLYRELADERAAGRA